MIGSTSKITIISEKPCGINQSQVGWLRLLTSTSSSKVANLKITSNLRLSYQKIGISIFNTMILSEITRWPSYFAFGTESVWLLRHDWPSGTVEPKTWCQLPFPWLHISISKGKFIHSKQKAQNSSVSNSLEIAILTS